MAIRGGDINSRTHIVVYKYYTQVILLDESSFRECNI